MSGESRSILLSFPERVGAGSRAVAGLFFSTIVYVGSVARLLASAAVGAVRPAPGTRQRARITAFMEQSYRFGVHSLPIVALVQVFIGIILALNLAPTLESYGQIERTADVVAIAVFRELGALITAVLMSGFAGAAIAAELGAMVEGEEIKALRSHAIDPIRFLVVPRVFATAVMMVGLVVFADVCGLIGGLFTAVFVLNIDADIYVNFTSVAIGLMDFLTGLIKAFVFGAVIAGIACHEGLNVRGGAAGVGNATTTTVVKSIVALVAADVVFASLFYTVGW